MPHNPQHILPILSPEEVRARRLAQRLKAREQFPAPDFFAQQERVGFTPPTEREIFEGAGQVIGGAAELAGRVPGVKGAFEAAGTALEFAGRNIFAPVTAVTSPFVAPPFERLEEARRRETAFKAATLPGKSLQEGEREFNAALARLNRTPTTFQEKVRRPLVDFYRDVAAGRVNLAQAHERLAQIGQDVPGEIAFTADILNPLYWAPVPGGGLLRGATGVLRTQAAKRATELAKVAETVAGVPLRPAMRRAVAARPAGAAGETVSGKRMNIPEWSRLLASPVVGEAGEKGFVYWYQGKLVRAVEQPLGRGGYLRRAVPIEATEVTSWRHNKAALQAARESGLEVISEPTPGFARKEQWAQATGLRRPPAPSRERVVLSSQPAQSVPAAAKEPWQMTKAEVLEKDPFGDMTAQGQWRPGRREETLKTHYQIVTIALREGKPVPAEVLKDYPDLAAQARVPSNVPPVAPAQAVPEQAVSALSAEMEARLRAVPAKFRPGQIRAIETGPLSAEEKAARIRVLREEPVAQAVEAAAVPMHPTLGRPLTQAEISLKARLAKTSKETRTFPSPPPPQTRMTPAQKAEARALEQELGFAPKPPISEVITPKRAEITVREAALEPLAAPKRAVVRRKPVSQEPRAVPPSAQQPISPQAAEAPIPSVAAGAPEKLAPPAGAPPPEQPDGVKRLIQLINEAKPVRAETEALKHTELQKRTAILASMQAKAGTREELLRAIGAAKGELPRADFEPPMAGLTDAQWDSLFLHVRDSGKLRPWEIENTAFALEKVRLGQNPTLGEIEQLERVFGEEFAKALLAKRPWGETLRREIASAVNLPRALVSSFDMSATLRQGGWYSTSRPGEILGAFKAQVSAMKDEKFAQALDDAIRGSPTFERNTKAGLYIAPRLGVAGAVSAREEAFMSSLAHKIPWVRVSERGYVTFLNKLRTDLMDGIVQSWERAGKTVVSQDLTELATYINRATGRGGPRGMTQGEIGAFANALFFSPRFAVSRVTVYRSLFSPSALVRREAWRDLLLFAGPRISLLVAGSAAGLWSVEFDPRSSDFGKFHIGPMRVDPWAGLQPVVRYAAQLATKERKVLATGQLQPIGPGETGFRFLRSKLAPAPSVLADFYLGATFTGERVDIIDEARRTVFPILPVDIIEAMTQTGFAGASAATVLSGLGAGVQTFEAKGLPAKQRPTMSETLGLTKRPANLPPLPSTRTTPLPPGLELLRQRQKQLVPAGR